MLISYTLAELASQLGGRVLGDANTRVSKVATLEKAQTQQISFLTNKKYRALLAETQASAVILGEIDAELSSLPRIISDNPYAYFAKVSALLNPAKSSPQGVHASAVLGQGCQIHPSAYIAATAVLGDHVTVGANSIIGEGCYVGDDTVLGESVKLYPKVVIYHNCVVGNRLIAHSGVIIGADGFGIAMDQGRWIKVPQVGRVVIGDDVEIGANTTIDRGALEDTIIEDGVKMDNLIQIAHNVRIGAHTAIAAFTGVAGSTSIGRYCLIGGASRFVGHITVADRVNIAATSMITKSITEEGSSYTGIFPSYKTEDWRNNAVHLRHLDKLVSRIKQLEQQVAGLTAKEEESKS